MLHRRRAAPARGSTFCFEMALLPASNDPAVERSYLPERLAGIKVLIVDDVAMNIEILARQLRASHGRGIPSPTASRRWRSWNGPGFNRVLRLVMLDQMMPGLAGTELAGASAPRRRGRHEAGCWFSGPPDWTCEWRGRLALDAQLEKPIRRGELLSAGQAVRHR